MVRDDRSGGDGGPGAPLRPDPAAGAVDLGDELFSAPGCPACLRRMEPASTASGGVYWDCLHCGQTRLA